MTDGVTADLAELIALQRFAQRVAYKRSARALNGGAHLSRLRGRGMDFAEVRNYQAGDEIRHMEWRVTARTGRPHVKLYQEERERPVVLFTDFSPSMYFGTRIAFKSVVSARLSAMIAWTVARQGDKTGALLFSADSHSEFMPRAREHGILPLLACLSDYSKRLENINKVASNTLFNDALLRLRRVARPGSILVLISDFYQMNVESEKQLHRLREHNDILAYHICDPLELHPPKPASYAVTDGQQELLLDTGNHQVQTNYQQWCEQRHDTLRNAFKRLQIQQVQVTADQDIAKLVHQTYPRRLRD